MSEWIERCRNLVASKLYGVNATIIIFVFVLYKDGYTKIGEIYKWVDKYMNIIIISP